jgi:hypothetical protein
MKTIITLAFLSFFAITTSAVGTQNQSSESLSSTTVTNGFKFFRVHRQGSGVAMSWACTSPNVASFIVERSYDGDFFESAADVNCNGSDLHKFAETDVFPGIIYYRIKAVKSDGSTEMSAVASVRIVRRG